jgi:predicted pyridoxine 5'-phosphate oxidase superfamily flavin-nucleotide-binding protein
MDDTVLQYVRQCVLCWLATIDDDGAPTVSPKEIFCAHDNRTLLIANVASPQSLSNILARPAVCVSLVDVFVQKGFKLKGKAKVARAGDARFPALAQPLVDMAGKRFPFSSLFVIDVHEVEPIIAPSYRLYPETLEADQVRSAMRTYGVRPLHEQTPP